MHFATVLRYQTLLINNDTNSQNTEPQTNKRIISAHFIHWLMIY